jgi:hypothetical protein
MRFLTLGADVAAFLGGCGGLWNCSGRMRRLMDRRSGEGGTGESEEREIVRWWSWDGEIGGGVPGDEGRVPASVESLGWRDRWRARSSDDDEEMRSVRPFQGAEEEADEDEDELGLRLALGLAGLGMILLASPPLAARLAGSCVAQRPPLARERSAVVRTDVQTAREALQTTERRPDGPKTVDLVQFSRGGGAKRKEQRYLLQGFVIVKVPGYPSLPPCHGTGMISFASCSVPLSLSCSQSPSREREREPGEKMLAIKPLLVARLHPPRDCAPPPRTGRP